MSVTVRRPDLALASALVLAAVLQPAAALSTETRAAPQGSRDGGGLIEGTWMVGDSIGVKAPSITYRAGVLTAYVACGRYGGSYAVLGSTILPHEIFKMEGACPPGDFGNPRLARDRRRVEPFVISPVSFKVSSDRLVLITRDHSRLVLERAN